MSTVFSFLTWMKNPTSGNVKALAAKDDSSQVLGLEWNYRFDTLVVNRGTTPHRNRTLTQRVVLSLVSAVYYPTGLWDWKTFSDSAVTNGLTTPRSHRLQVRWVDWRINEVNWNNDP